MLQPSKNRSGPETTAPLASVLPASAFPGRLFLRCDEIAKVVLCTPQHVANLCHNGTIRGAVSVASGTNTSRPSFRRIQVTAYEAWIKGKSNIGAFQE